MFRAVWEPRPIFRGALSPAIIVAWLWSGLLILLLVYLRTLLSYPSAEDALRIRDFHEFWLGPTPVGLPLRHVVKVVNVLLIALLWIRFRTMRRIPGPSRLTGRLLYLGTAVLILALEWACHVLGESLERLAVRMTQL